MIDAVRKHDPESCHDGDGCKPCRIAEQGAELLRLAQTTRLPAGAKARALDVLKEQAKRTAERMVPRLASLLVACSLLFAGCVAPEAIEQARNEAAICHGHAMDASLPLEARMIGADGERAWQAQHGALCGGDRVPGSETWEPLPPELAPAGPR